MCKQPGTTSGSRALGRQRRAQEPGPALADETDPGGFIEVSPEVQTHLSGQQQPKAPSGVRLPARLRPADPSGGASPRGQLTGVDPQESDGRLQDKHSAKAAQVGSDNSASSGDKGHEDTAPGLGGADQTANSGAERGIRAQQLRKPKLAAGAEPSGAIYYGLAAAGARARHLARRPAGSQAPEGQQPATAANDYINRLYLDSSMPLEVQAHVGTTAYLVCRLRSIQQGDHLQVSWVRNMQILTSGELRYTSDERFRPTHVAGTHDWALEIHQVSAQDEGEYECQVNSEPKAASVSLYLDVIAASIEILEQSPVMVEEDAQIRLTCRVEFDSQRDDKEPPPPPLPPQQPRQSWHLGTLDPERQLPESSGPPAAELEPPRPPGDGREASGRARNRVSAAPSSQHYIYWYKDEVNLLYNNPRGGVRVERHESSSSLDSVLTLEEARPSDSGVYVCKVLPELNEVAPAQCQVVVGGTTGSSGFSFGTSGAASSGRRADPLAWPINGTGWRLWALLVHLWFVLCGSRCRLPAIKLHHPALWPGPA